MKDVYLTSTFSNQWNVAFNPKIGKALEDRGLRCYLAHRDTDQTGTRAEIFHEDIDGIRNSSMILAVALNETPNWGAELGFAYATRKPILALMGMQHAIPLICEGMITEVFRVEDLDALEEYVDLLVEKIQHALRS